MLYKKQRIYSGYFVAFVPHLNDLYISEIAVYYLFKVDLVVLEMNDVLKKTFTVFCLLLTLRA